MTLSTYGGDAVETDAPRYGEQANVEHHPQVTDYVPRRKRAVLLVLAAGLGAAAGAQAIAEFAEPIAAILGVDAAALVRVAEGGVAWASAVSLIGVALLAKLIYSLRRHRVDDYQGHYRVWRWVAWGGWLASANAVIGAHSLLAESMTAVTGLSITSTGAEWWLAPLTLVGGWVAVRLGLEIAESRGAVSMMTLAVLCYVAAAAGALGWAPAGLGGSADALTRGLPLLGHAIALASLFIFGRYVVLDVQGLIDHSRPAEQPVAAARTQPMQPAVERPALESSASPAISVASLPASALQSGCDEADEDSEDQHVHKLSKMEKRRLRKQNRAA